MLTHLRNIARTWDCLLSPCANQSRRRLGLEALEAREVPAAFGLFETGVDAAGVPLSAETADPHYTLTGSGLSAGGSRVIADDGFPIGPWVGNDSDSRWIVPAGLDGDGNAAPGTYVYRTTVDVTGYDPSSITISGNWAADNSAVIRLNGADTENVVSGFSALTGFTLPGFHAGVNVVEFVVANGDNGGPNPTGLQVSGVTGTRTTQVGGPERVLGVYNTGAGLADGAQDVHWVVTSAPSAELTGAAVQATPHPLWVSPGSASGWVVPRGTTADSAAPEGTYVFQTTFDLTGYDPATASLSGLWAVDNAGAEVLLNGVSLGLTHSRPAQFSDAREFMSLDPFAVSAGFVAGVNMITFVVLNERKPVIGNPNPTGLLVDGLQVYAKLLPVVTVAKTSDVTRGASDSLDVTVVFYWDTPAHQQVTRINILMHSKEFGAGRFLGNPVPGFDSYEGEGGVETLTTSGIRICVLGLSRPDGQLGYAKEAVFTLHLE
ncbi:MAG TPA: hypothetical protein VGE74_05735 [Gemmata sp.]